jgi:hypothetical protein
MPARLSPLHCTIAAFCLVFTAALPGQQDAIRYTRDVLPGDYPIVRGTERWLCYRIVDEFTSAPIAGAELFLVAESKTPIGGEFWSTRQSKSDANGNLRVRTDDIDGKWHHLVLRAAGHAVSSRCNPGELIWRVAPPQNAPVQLRNWRGDPAVLAMVGICGGCGHCPDLATATSGPDGIALLRDIDPHNEIADLYVQGDGLGIAYRSLQWRPGDPPFLLDCGWSEPMTGKLLDHNGKPIAAVFIGSHEIHRGPWARTGADGIFRVLGASGNEDLIARLADREVRFERPPAFPATLRAPVPDGEPNQQVDAEPAPKADDKPPVPITVAISGETSGEAPSVHVSCPRWQPRDEPGVPLTVPADGPFALVLSVDGDCRYFPFANAAALPPQPIALRWFKPTRIVGKAVDTEGKPVAVRVRAASGFGEFSGDGAASVDGVFTVAAHHTGLTLVELVPQRADLRPRRVFATLPHRGDDVSVDLGAVVLAAAPQLTVTDGDGRALPGLRVAFARPGFQETGTAHSFPLDASGGWLGPDLRAGDLIVITAKAADGEIAVPQRVLLSGGGPWAIHPPAGCLELHVRDVDGDAVAAVAVLADASFDVDGDARLVGLPAGSLQLHVSAPGCLSALISTTIAATGKKELRLDLPRR